MDPSPLDDDVARGPSGPGSSGAHGPGPLPEPRHGPGEAEQGTSVSGAGVRPGNRPDAQEVLHLLTVIPDGVLLLSREGTILFANDAAETLLGQSEHELMGDLLGLPVGERGEIEIQVHRHDGPNPWVEVRMSWIPWRGQQAILCTLRDLTQRIEAEHALQETADRLDTLAHATFEGVFLQEDGHIVDLNEQGARLFGYEPGELIDGPVQALFHPEDREELEQAASQEGATVRGVRKDGSSFWIEVRADTVAYEGRRVRQSVVRDIDTHKRLEDALQAFAHTVSHDLKEPLRTMTGFAKLIQRRYGDQLPQGASELLDEVIASGRTMRGLIEGILTAAEEDGQAPARGPVELDDVVEDACSALAHRLEEADAEVTADQLPPVLGRELQLVQVFLNLISNAVCHGGQGVTIEITAKCRDGQAEITVADDGPGIDPEEQEAIFQAFRQGDSADPEGSGVGLATCQSIIKRHGGKIWAVPSDDEGATIKLCLPLASDA